MNCLTAPEGRNSKMDLTGLKSLCWQGCILPEALGENLISCLFQLVEATCILWLVAPPSIFEIINIGLNLSRDAIPLALFSASLFHSPL